MTGNDPINITLTIDQWRSVYRILNEDRERKDHPIKNVNWNSHLQEIEERCQNNETTLTFKLAMTWSMSATIRLVNPELAEEISRQMSAQAQTTWWDSADSTPESSPPTSEPTASSVAE